MSIGGWFNGWTNSNDSFNDSTEEGEPLFEGNGEFPITLDLSNFNPEFQRAVQEEQERRIREQRIIQLRKQQEEEKKKAQERKLKHENEMKELYKIRRERRNELDEIARVESVIEARSFENFIETQTNQFYFMIYQLVRKHVEITLMYGNYKGVRRIINIEYSIPEMKIMKYLNDIIEENQNRKLKTTQRYIIFINNSLWELLKLLNVEIKSKNKSLSSMTDRRIMMSYFDKNTNEKHEHEEIMEIGKIVRDKMNERYGRKKVKNEQLMEIAKEVEIELHTVKEDLDLVKVIDNHVNEWIAPRYKIEEHNEKEEEKK